MVEAEQAYQLADVFLTFKVGFKEAMHAFLAAHNTSNKGGRAPWRGEDLFLDKAAKVWSRESTRCSDRWTSFPARQQADILGICTRTIALASSMQD
jgi:hypothetical protein